LSNSSWQHLQKGINNKLNGAVLLERSNKNWTDRKEKNIWISAIDVRGSDTRNNGKHCKNLIKKRMNM
jgi:hypothetical protein